MTNPPPNTTVPSEETVARLLVDTLMSLDERVSQLETDVNKLKKKNGLAVSNER
jgi:hypothetical protein